MSFGGKSTSTNAPRSVILIIPILLGRGFWRFSLSKPASYGFWSMAHEARVDYAMLLGSIFLLIVGAGAWSIDARLSKR
jgi:putative oxidoreductase